MIDFLRQVGSQKHLLNRHFPHTKNNSLLRSLIFLLFICSETHRSQAVLIAGHEKLEASNPPDHRFAVMKLNDPLFYIIQHMHEVYK